MRLDGQEKCPIGNGGGHYLFRLNPGLMGFDRISRLQSVYCERFFFRFPLFRDPRQLLGARSVMGGSLPIGALDAKPSISTKGKAH